MSMHALPTEIHWTTEKGTWKVLEISRPHIQNFKTTVPIFKTTKCGQDHTKIGTESKYTILVLFGTVSIISVKSISQ